jgi:hypothetical protein
VGLQQRATRAGSWCLSLVCRPRNSSRPRRSDNTIQKISERGVGAEELWARLSRRPRFYCETSGIRRSQRRTARRVAARCRPTVHRPVRSRPVSEPIEIHAGGVVPYAEQQPRLAGATVEQNGALRIAVRAVAHLPVKHPGGGCGWGRFRLGPGPRPRQKSIVQNKPVHPDRSFR